MVPGPLLHKPAVGPWWGKGPSHLSAVPVIVSRRGKTGLEATIPGIVIPWLGFIFNVDPEPILHEGLRLNVPAAGPGVGGVVAFLLYSLPVQLVKHKSLKTKRLHIEIIRF